MFMTYKQLSSSDKTSGSSGNSLRLGQTKPNHTSNTNTLDLLTGDDLNEKDTGGDGWGDDDDFEDWGSLEEGRF